MGTTTIDVVQSAQITELQDDVVALKDEINKIVADITSMVTATNTLKSNVEDIDERMVVLMDYSIHVFYYNVCARFVRS